MKPKPTLRHLLTTFAVLALCGCPIGKSQTRYRPHGHSDVSMSHSPVEDTIVFNATGEGGRDLYLLRLDDLQVTRVAASPEYETSPSFSSDGTELVYAAGVNGPDHIFRRPVEGGEAKQLTTANANDSSPRFSPDGSLIVFARDKTYNPPGGLAADWDLGGVICIVDRDGNNERQLTPDDTFAYAPHFFNDGQFIHFSTLKGRARVPVDGSSAPESIPGEKGAMPSPDGTLLAYSKGKYSPDCKIYVAKAGGSDQRLVTPDQGGCFHPIFSRSGDRLFFFLEEWPTGPTGVPKYHLWEVGLEGKPSRRIASFSLFDDPLGESRQEGAK